jgi:hypothetical protein
VGEGDAEAVEETAESNLLGGSTAKPATQTVEDLIGLGTPSTTYPAP